MLKEEVWGGLGLQHGSALCQKNHRSSSTLDFVEVQLAINTMRVLDIYVFS